MGIKMKIVFLENGMIINKHWIFFSLYFLWFCIFLFFYFWNNIHVQHEVTISLKMLWKMTFVYIFIFYCRPLNGWWHSVRRSSQQTLHSASITRNPIPEECAGFLSCVLYYELRSSQAHPNKLNSVLAASRNNNPSVWLPWLRMFCAWNGKLMWFVQNLSFMCSQLQASINSWTDFIHVNWLL